MVDCSDPVAVAETVVVGADVMVESEAAFTLANRAMAETME